MMMQAILVDDERSALIQLERLLRADGRVEMTGMFNSATAALEYLASERTDIIFLDIGMPEINGLEAAEIIQQLDIDIHVVFVTAYSEYAIEAFELQALDYLLKPVHPQRLSKTIDRVAGGTKAIREPAPVKEPNVLCFQKLEITDSIMGETGRRHFKWRTLKSQELFAYLLHNGREWIGKQELLNELWPRYTPEKAVVHLHTSVYQIRKAMKEWTCGTKLEFSLDRYRLTRGGWTTDVEEFERSMTDIYASGRPEAARLDQVLGLYRGNYLEEHDYPWAYSKREKLRRKYMKGVMDAAADEMYADRTRQAAERLLALQHKEPYSEEVCCQLLEVYARMGDYKAAEEHYGSFKKLLKDDLDISPESSTQQLFERLIMYKG
ncbi:response regulator [Paenibacillus sp. P96]|uniref:Response regulator n=1 Tax=Paenibacillus zeirhizosphaerae TaxID=2987519 RepID=A0ABT9FMS1_9BACL|nr:response regulator [Paenibacillus sp. P96]MDP4096017.1 response regulator [Paenibacillus sp. P96]